MPARDSCEPQMIHALEKDQWEILDRDVLIQFGRNKRKLYADLLIKPNDVDMPDTRLIIEVKYFSSDHILDDFYHAVGQYLVYRNALQILGNPIPLYLAIPLSAYNTFFQEIVIQRTIQEVKLQLLVVDLQTERIVQWLP